MNERKVDIFSSSPVMIRTNMLSLDLFLRFGIEQAQGCSSIVRRIDQTGFGVGLVQGFGSDEDARSMIYYIIVLQSHRSDQQH